MMEQNVQTFITWTHGVQPTWLQYHGPSLHNRELRAQGEMPIRIPAPPPPPPQFVLPPPPPPPPPPEIFHSQFVPTMRTSPTSPTSSPRGESCPVTTSSDRTRQSVRSIGHLRAGDPQHRTRAHKRARTVKSVASSVAERYSRRPFTMFTPKRSTRVTRSRTTRCKHHAQWPEVSFSLRATSAGALSLPMCTSSTAVARRHRTF